MTLLDRALALNARIDAALARIDDRWIGLAARFLFAAVLALYYLNSAMTKIDGLPIFFSDSAYFQILPGVIEAYEYDAAAVPVFPWWFVIAAGTWAEFVLPALIVLGLMTRGAALGMIGFILVQSYVDLTAHGVAGGALFDRHIDGVIWDQRSFWVFALLLLVWKGAGALSLDGLIRRRVSTPG